MTTSVRVLLLFAALALAGVIYVVATTDSDSDAIVIGVVVPLTGDASAFGTNVVRGAQLAAFEEGGSEAVGGREIRVVVEDSRGEPAQAVAAARKLLSVDGATMLIGDVTSAGTHALLPVVERASAPLVSPSASDPALTGKSEWFARVWPSDVFEAKVIAGHAIAEKLSKLAVIYANTDYGVAMVEEFKMHFPATSLITEVAIDSEVSDYRPTIQRLDLNGADGLFLIAYPESIERFLAQMKEQGVSIPILATATFEDPKLLKQPLSEGVVFASPAPPSDPSSRRAAFMKAYADRFGEAPGVLSDTGYDAARLLLEAWRIGGNERPAAIARAIRGMSDFAGVSGVMSFDENGDVVKDYRLKVVKDGAFVWRE